jgi:hypothetical protein
VNIVSVLNSKLYRVSVLALAALLTMVIFYITLGMKPRLDPAPDIKPITPAKYNEWAQYADVLSMGVFITNFGVADFSQGLFIVDAFIWVQFNPLVFSLDTVSQFSIDKGKMVSKEFIEAIRVGEELFVRYRVRFEVKSNMNFKYYPLDSHRIYATIKYDNLAPSEVIVMTAFSRTWFGSNAVSPNWLYGEPAANFGYLEAHLDDRNLNNVVLTSAGTVFFDFERATLREAMVVFGPYIIMLFIILSSLLMGWASFQMIIITVVSILGMILQRIIIGHMSAITSYFILSDCVMFLALGCAFLVLMIEIISAVYEREETWWLDTVRSSALTLSSLLFLVGWFYLLYIW